MKFLLDTNVFKEMGKSEPHENVAAWMASTNDNEYAVSAITVREIIKGVERLRGSKPDLAHKLGMTVDAMLAAISDRIVPVDEAVAREWARMLAQSEKHIDDTGLAATARVHDMIVVTRNVSDFDGRDVRVLDPFKADPSRRRV